MKKALLVIMGLFVMNSFALAQVICDFEKDANGFSDNGWDKGFASVSRAADPTGKSTGVLKLSFDGSKGQKGDIQKDEVDASKGQIMTYWIYLPKGTPDSVQLKIWGQDKGTWTWTEQAYLTKDIPKEVWYPLNFYMEQYRIDTKNYKFDAKTNKIGKMGLEVNVYGETDADKTWKGDILVDNVSLVGAEPKVNNAFETTIEDYKRLWGDASLTLSQIADPSKATKGVLEVNYATKSGAFGSETQVDASKFQVLTFWVNLPSTAPDSLFFKVFIQDAKNWGWDEVDYYAKSIPRDVWYPLYFDMAAVMAKDAKFDYKTAKLGKFGIEMSSTNWTGKMLVDNVSFLGIETGAKWVLAGFESTVGGVQGFAAPNWATAVTGIERGTDGTNGVLKAYVDYSKGAKVAVTKDNVSLYYAEKDTIIDKITIDVFVPADMPKDGQVDLVVQPNSDWAWINKTYNIADSAVAPGKWNTLTWDVKEFRDKITDRKAKNNVFVEFKYGTPSTTYKGTIMFDNLTLWGIPEPVMNLASPTVQAKVDTMKVVSGNIQWINLQWADNSGAGAETYNIYMSEKPITDLTSKDVKQIASKVPHGNQQYPVRPWTTDGSTKTYYLAVTAFDGTTETPLSSACKTNAITLTQTSKTAKVKYVKDFAKTFVLDGMDTEFESYKANEIKPESCTDNTWTPASTDINFKTTMVIDDKYLYISADVTDDDLRQSTTMQAWEGDALEFFMGFYDTRPLKAYHEKNFSTANGDWRMGFMSTGQSALDGGSATAIKGVESTVFEKLTGDGYIIEARICLDSVAQGGKFTLSNGMLMPFKIDCNDMDPVTKKETARGRQAQYAINGADADQSWLRPGAWGYMEVIGAPTGVDEANMLPKEYKLYNNYPNPFNPATMIRYDLPKDSKVILKVYDIIGREVATLVNEDQKAGTYEFNFNASQLSSGVYIYRLNAGNFSHSQKMMLVK